ncbi:restriction endonuclease subunit R [Oceanidesulfovibrio indonesiensis]|uniref:Type I restriction enzyme endonuclease subunit n=1 Tax=Oceanidesulfovibrio indonesiensis TaxID=54767 RepID=A0A7M3M9Y8_9BACT|nr:type I restriction endonuclease subunit R [Oceanidesulfovibrio indonesiensis]TVM14018.1 restriction endonuclease subunit R [Oceanidesulfovibrio indonesiensis]
MFDFKEYASSHAPALVLLEQLGYEYIPPTKALAMRGGRKSMPVLVDILDGQLRRMNTITFKGQAYEFSDANIKRAVREVAQVPFDSLITTSEQIYDLLTLGVSLEQTIDGSVKSHSLKYIDWEHPENNVYHVCDEFEFERRHSDSVRKPDIVLFINGIPVSIIECKRPDKREAIKEGISQHIRNQRVTEIPELYVYSQVLLSVSQNRAMFGTTDTDEKFWSVWKEEDAQTQNAVLERIINTPLSEEQKARLFLEATGEQRQALERVLTSGQRTPTPQDKAIHALLRPERLLQLMYGFIVYDNRIKKIARYQQYFAVQATVDRVTDVKGDSRRKGGVIWHTTGSGKSLTMVMLAKALTIDPRIQNPKVIIVTDRIDLDKQITKTFRACGKDVVQARTGEHLLRLIAGGRASVITTVIGKFETVANKRTKDEDRNIFVLVDESHRSNYGQSHAKMRVVFPNACYIGFTGTPLLKKEKSTAETFGGFIHKYTMNQAVQDKAVEPLRYEGRMSELHGDDAELDKWFDRITEGLTPEQKGDLKKKFKQAEQLFSAEARIAEVAYDIGQHFKQFCKGTGKKAQFAVSSREAVLAYQKCFEEQGEVSVAVVMSSPDSREGNTSTDASKIPEVQAFWNDMMAKYGNEKNYLECIINAFNYSDDPEILIVIDKLLTGFDAPRNSVLYLDKNLKEHNILQAIARVNRLWDGKEYGLVVDYRGIFGALNEAIDTYAALEKEGFDRADIENTIIDVSAEIEQLKARHANVWEVFKEVENKADIEAMQLALEPEDVRERFYDALRLFANTLQLALSNARFLESTPEKTIHRYKNDLKDFLNLRNAVKHRFGEAVDYSAYEQQLKNMVSKHIGADAVQEVIAPVDIFAVDAFDEQLELIEGDAAKADHIASRVKKTITVKMDEDPTLYQRLSEIINETISNHRARRLSDAEYLSKMRGLLEDLKSGERSNVPNALRGKDDAIAYFGVIGEMLGASKDAEAHVAEMALQIDEAIASRKIRDWSTNIDIKNKMMNDIDEILYDASRTYEMTIPGESIDALIDKLLLVAQRRDLA